MLTILIPTMNRSDFLIRLLKYYSDTGYKHWIFIGDSSGAYHMERTKNAIHGLEVKLKIIYREYPDLSNKKCMQQMLIEVSTPYAVYIADDDFLVPNGLEQCIYFLKKNPSYNSVHGIANTFSLQSSGPQGDFSNSYSYRLPSIEAETASQRTLDYLNNYSVTQFCVHTIDSWRAMYKDVASLNDRSFAEELLPCCLSVIQGKVKQLDCLYLLRQVHNTRYELPDINEWINHPNWNPSYKTFRDCLAEKLARQDDITLNKAKDIVEEAFRSYLNNRKNNMISARLGKAARYVPGMKQVLAYFKHKRSGNLSLPMLLNPNSPYHSDFMPVYHAVTTPPDDCKI